VIGVVSWKKVAIAFFYNTLKSFVRQVAGGFLGSLATVPDDLVMALIGYLVHTKTQYKEEGEALLLASIASLGTTAGTLFFRPTQALAPAPAPAPMPAPGGGGGRIEEVRAIGVEPLARTPEFRTPVIRTPVRRTTGRVVIR
jgi:hypothetical protein